MKRVSLVFGSILFLFAFVVLSEETGPFSAIVPEKIVETTSHDPETVFRRPISLEEPKSYTVKKSPKGLSFSSATVQLETKGILVTQGGEQIHLMDPVFDRTDPSLLWIDYGKIQEEYRYETHRIEQLFHIQEPVGKGAFVVKTAVQTNFEGPVIEVPAGEGGWNDPRMENGGLWFCDEAGNKRIAYYGAMAIDAAGRRIDLEPTYDSGEISLEIPASYMMNVVYPLLVDPWIDATSLYGDGNVSNSADSSGKPSICVDLSDNIFIAYEE
ncbi:MAG: hypothetical protein QF645_08470, partial [Planctomycetota bacterium]|nr:hypothetical protein [Planctomycetota bacterium]